jgi:acyl-coenzyme A thioesterase PaaI-like protein
MAAEMTDNGGSADARGADIARIARQFIEAIPFSRALGMRLTEIGDGAVISMPYDTPRSSAIRGPG